jgi:hypothetical protein
VELGVGRIELKEFIHLKKCGFISAVAKKFLHLIQGRQVAGIPLRSSLFWREYAELALKVPTDRGRRWSFGKIRGDLPITIGGLGIPPRPRKFLLDSRC